MNIIDFLRQYKIGSFSIFDFALAYIGLFLLSPLIIKALHYFHIRITQMNIMWLVLPLAILVHVLVGQHTPMTKMFLDLHNYYFLKALILFMIYMGFKGVIW
jgi:hypothetical protein